MFWTDAIHSRYVCFRPFLPRPASVKSQYIAQNPTRGPCVEFWWTGWNLPKHTSDRLRKTKKRYLSVDSAVLFVVPSLVDKVSINPIIQTKPRLICHHHTWQYSHPDMRLPNFVQRSLALFYQTSLHRPLPDAWSKKKAFRFFYTELHSMAHTDYIPYIHIKLYIHILSETCRMETIHWNKRPLSHSNYIYIYSHVFLFTWLIVVGSGSDESIYWTLTGRNHN
jgi:hypothetical protein